MEAAKSLLEQINMARLHPQYLIQDLNLQLQHFESENCMKTIKGQRLQVIEGSHIWKYAAEFLEGLTPRRGLTLCPQLCTVACEYESRVARGEELSGFKLLKEHYQYNGNISFNTCQSEADQTSREMVLSMIVDDGDERRGNRKTLFDQNYRYFGACVTKRDNINVIVMFFSDTDDFRVKGSGNVRSRVNTYCNRLNVPQEQEITRTRVNSDCYRINVPQEQQIDRLVKSVRFQPRQPFGSRSENQHHRLPVKKTVKSSIVARFGRTMKVKTTKTEYDDGTVSENEVQELLV